MLHNTCHVERGNAQGKVESSAKLWLCPDAAGKETCCDHVIELELSAYTLRTIANPLHKYFLWFFVDLLPFLFLWLCRALLYLAYHLTVGLLLREEAAPGRPPPFAGMVTTREGSRVRCRGLEPRLAWRAMAAHRSQFVWYRRLSVLFSRYTYVNDLRKLSIELPLLPTLSKKEEEDEENDDMASSLPPVVAMKESASAPPFLLTPNQMHALRAAVIPTTLHHRPWRRVYCLSRDGDAFATFRRQLDAWYGEQSRGGGHATLLVVKTTAGEVAGGFADAPLVPRAAAAGAGGNAAGSCLFAVRAPGNPDGPDVVAYGRRWSSAKCVVCDPARRLVAFGDNASGGGADEGYGLCLGDNFVRGTTSGCAAFGSPPLVAAPGGVFGIVDVEVWGFVFGQL